jgi:LmeA-like phospholipid-binding
MSPLSIESANSTTSEPEDSSPHKRGLVSRVLEPALQFWLRSQVESVAMLQVHLEGGDRQILSGSIPQVRLEADRAIYRGLHLTHVQICGSNIRINIGQVIKGKPLKLLDPIPVDLKVWLQTPDVQVSLQSELFQTALIEALPILVGDRMTDALGTDLQPKDLTLKDLDLQIGVDRLRFTATLVASNGNSIPIGIQTGLALDSPSSLTLKNPEWLPTPQSKRGLALHDLEGYRFDLGPEANLQVLSITPEGIRIQGRLAIVP